MEKGRQTSTSADLPAAFLGALLLTASAGEALGADWPQLANGPERHGYSSEKIDVPIKNAWAHGFSPERLHPQTQPVVADGRVFIGTAMGTLHAFEAKTGKNLWTFEAGGPVLHTAGVEGGKVFFGCMDGCVYALEARSGRPAWKFESRLRTGFSTAVLLAEGKVFIANRGGVYYALSQKDGRKIWEQDVGVTLLMSSAYDRGRLFFGAMDMRVYALEARTGAIAWRSERLHGTAFKDHWPVAVGDHVIVRPMALHGRYSGLGARALSPLLPWRSGPLPRSELDKQQQVIDKYMRDPAGYDKNLYVLNSSDGKEAFVVPHWTCCTMNGATAPPCADGDGKLIVTACVPKAHCGGWARLDLNRRRVVEVLHEEGNARAGTGNGDENLAASAAGRLVFVMHTQEGNANFTGVWHLDRRKWTRIRAYGVDRYFFSNTQGGGASPCVIADGMIYHNTQNTLNARAATPAG